MLTHLPYPTFLSSRILESALLARKHLMFEYIINSLVHNYNTLNTRRVTQLHYDLQIYSTYSKKTLFLQR